MDVNRGKNTMSVDCTAQTASSDDTYSEYVISTSDIVDISVVEHTGTFIYIYSMYHICVI